MSILAVDPGGRTGWAYLGSDGVDVGVISLPHYHADAVRVLAESLNPWLLRADLVVVEDWTYQGRNVGNGHVLPLVVIGALLMMGAVVVSPLWKLSMTARVGFIRGLKAPTGLDARDKAMWRRLVVEGYEGVLQKVERLPKEDRPHALDALGLAVYCRLREVGYARGEPVNT